MILTFGTRLGCSSCSNDVNATSTEILASRFSIRRLVATLHFSHQIGSHVGLSFIQTRELRRTDSCKRINWSIKSSADGRGLDPPSGSGDGRTRLLKSIQNLQIRVNARIQDFRKDLPKKLLCFLVGFYCATAFATVIGQTGDWDIMSAAVAVAVVEGIGALMYKASVPLLDRSKNLIVFFNYWKGGLTLGLFLDSFKY